MQPEAPQGLVPVADILRYIQSDRYMPLREAVGYLGMSERTIRSRLSEIPHYRAGQKLLFRKSELDEWMLRYRHGPDGQDLDRIVEEVIAGVVQDKK